MRILVIHDDKSIAHAINSKLDETYYKIRYAGDGDAGLDIAMGTRFDVIVLQWWLPKKDGMSVLKNLRDAENLTPVLVLASEDSWKGVALSLDFEVNVSVAKTQEIGEVVTEIKNIIQISKLPQ
jgi:DNA-binding response OmpR family regulator